MPRDAEIGRALAAVITAGDTGRIKRAEFRYDPFLENDDLPKGVQLFIMPGTLNSERMGRGVWADNCTLDLMLIAPVAPNLPSKETAEQFIDSWLDSFDTMKELIKQEDILGLKAVSIEQDDRFDREALHESKRLICNCTVAYKLI